MMELLLNPKSEDVIEVLLNKKAEDMTVAADTCEHFAYRKSLLFYTTECKYCRYARMVKDKGSNARDCVCTYAAQMLRDSVG